MSDTNTTEKKARKTQPKAPNRAKDPVGFQKFQLTRALVILAKVDKQTTGWPGKVGFYASEASGEIDQAIGQLAEIPADFKAPRAKGHGGGRPVHRFVIGQRVTLSESAMARVNELFPDVAKDCYFAIATTAKEKDKLLPIVCTGIDGNLPSFFVDRARRSELKPFNP